MNRMSTQFAGTDTTPSPVIPGAKTIKQNDTAIIVGAEIAAPEPFSRSVTNTHPEQGITLSGVNEILLGAETGRISDFIDFADAMETKDNQYRTVLTSRKMAVAGLKVIVESASDSTEDSTAADLVRRILAGDWLADQMMNIMDAIGKGFSVLEIIWDYSNDGYLIPVDLKYRTQKFFTFIHPDGFIHDGTKLFLKNNDTASYSGTPLDTWPNNFLIHFPKQRSGLPIMSGTAYAAAYPYVIKQLLLRNWLKYSEVYAMPPRMGEYPKGTTKAKQDEFLAALHAMGSDATMIYEAGMKVQFAELKGQLGGGGGEKIFQNLVQYLDDGITKLALGQTLTTDNSGGRGSYALGAVHHAVRIDLLKADAKQLANTLNRYLVKPMVDSNFGQQSRYPIVRFNVQENIDLTVAQANIQAGVAMNVPIGVDHYRSIMSLPVPRVGEQLLTLPVAPIPGAAGVQGGTEAPKPAGGLPSGGEQPKVEGAAPKAAADATKKPSVASKPDGKSSPGDAAKKEKNVPLGEIDAVPTNSRVRMTVSQLRKFIFGENK